LDRIQREFREIKGTSAIIYDQMCATEKRRKRKRGSLTEPDERIVINELVCEGCGDCGEQSNCLSIEPLETEFGRKRRINQSTCNKDVSCVKGFCPSFVTVKGGQLKKPKNGKQQSLSALPELPQPVLPKLEGAWGIVVGGVGGTGVITIGQLLGMAAHLEGRGVVTQDAGGLAQKGGATWSHIQIAKSPELIYTSKVDVAKADLVIGCDAIVAASKTTLAVMQLGRTFVALNTHATPTAAFVHNTQWQFPAGGCEAALAAAVGTESLGAFDAEHIAVVALGDSIYTNPLLLGYAWQKGHVPLSHAALMGAMELNGVQVPNNQLAFEWGRHCAQHLDQVQATLQVRQVIELVKKPSVAELLAKRVAYLTAYQNAAYAQRYQALVLHVQQVESVWGKTRLTEAVAHNLFKLMAYKDEYEVARLYSDGRFAQKMAADFEGDVQLHFHLAPPMLAKTNSQGLLVKQRFGPWMMSAYTLLARLKGLRGTWLDPFGHTADRKQERALIDKYQNQIHTMLKIFASSPGGISAECYQKSIELANLPQDIRGFGHVKVRHITLVMEKWQGLALELVQLVGQPGSDQRSVP
jgi:indolepyruvate ferredoxin oxidoreductase